ncbi:MAG: ABC transporter permease subunit [Niameybacter sp.]|uniref:ABC transporter permease n=1 Tax=Niameybacter sp. TaxID=2033640 RepID=UPI002FC7DA9B
MKLDKKQVAQEVVVKSNWQRTCQRISNDKLLYLLIVPVLLWYLMFCYLPMGGLTLAFKEFRYDMGLWDSPWVGFQNFKMMFEDMEFWRALKNTLIFSFGKLVFHFPTPIILAILLNEITRPRLKKFYQTIFTFPHFISWVVLAGVLTNMFASNGIINQVLGTLGMDAISPLVSESAFRPFIWISNIWKEIGWDSIIYLAAFASIDPGLYEAAGIDGANRWQKMVHVSWPGIKSTVVIMFILAVGQIMTNGANFDQIFNLYSSPVYSVADTIDTYVFRKSFVRGGNFGYTTALGLFKSVVGVILLTTTNKIVTKSGEQGLF